MDLMPRRYCQYCGALLYMGLKKCPSCGMSRPSTSKVKILECLECGDVIIPGQVDHVCIRKGPEDVSCV